MTDQRMDIKKHTHTFLPLEICQWLVVAVVPYLAACYLVPLTSMIISSMRNMAGFTGVAWLDGVIVDLLSTGLFILVGIVLAPRLKFQVSVLMCLVVLYIHYNPAGVHGFVTDTLLGSLPASLKNLIPAPKTFCSGNPWMYVGVVFLGATICFSEWKLGMARSIAAKAYKESIDTLYNPGQKQ